MELEQAIFVSLTTLKDADSGASGLNNTSSSVYIRTWTLTHDQLVESLHNWPKVLVEVIQQDSSPFVSAGIPAGDVSMCRTVVVRMHLYTRREPGTTIDAALANRVRQIFHRSAPAKSGDWTFDQLHASAPQRAPSSGTETHVVLDFHTVATHTPS